jgi:hypothetical protein
LRELTGLGVFDECQRLARDVTERSVTAFPEHIDQVQ